MKSPLDNFILISFILISFTFLLSKEAFTFSSSAISDRSSIQHNDAETSATDEIVPEKANISEQKTTDNEEELFEETEEEVVRITDPICPWNKAMYHFNDKFYFWMLKPVTQGYSSVVPEDLRLAASNFFYNLTTPIRLISSLLQLKMKDAGKELVSFVYNSTVGVCGLANAAKTDLNISRHDEDLGQTLGSYGIGHGFYIVWPFLGPSSLRDTIGEIGNFFLNPVNYVNPAEATVGITVYDEINETSFHIGDYEDLKKSAVDPYVSIRNAYVQHRKKKVEE